MTTPNPTWSPRTPPVTREDFDTCPVLVVHYWAVWDLHDREMDERLAPLREAYADRICFRSCDTDRPENQPFIHGIATVPALGCFIRGTWHQSLIGLRSVEELRVVFVNWMAAADALERTTTPRPPP
jgi:hypothetical protein